MVMGKAHTFESLIARAVKRPDTGCFMWTGQIDSWGYGRVFFRGQKITAHKAVWLAAGHVIPDRLQLDHLCEIKSCVNPNHLELVTASENCKRRPTRNQYSK